MTGLDKKNGLREGLPLDDGALKPVEEVIPAAAEAMRKRRSGQAATPR